MKKCIMLNFNDIYSGKSSTYTYLEWKTTYCDIDWNKKESNTTFSTSEDKLEELKEVLKKQQNELKEYWYYNIESAIKKIDVDENWKHKEIYKLKCLN